MKALSSIAIASAAAAGLCLAAPAAASVTISFAGGNSALNGTAGNIRSFTSNGVTVQASAFDYYGSTLQRSFLGWYSSGLGVTDPGENGQNNSHTIDNSGRLDFVILVFNQAVNIQSAVLTPFSLGGTPDNDARVSYATLLGAFTPNPTAIPLNSSVWSLLNSNSWNVSGNNGAGYLTSLNSLGDYGNVWLIGASSPNPDNRYDAFKLTSITVNTPQGVPEPATWAMMIIGFGAAGVALRRRKSIGTVESQLA
jgi:hypothetical protein